MHTVTLALAHNLFDILHIYIHTSTEYQVYTEYKERPSITRTHAVSSHLLTTKLLGGGGLKEETQWEKENDKKTNKKIKYFKRFFQIF